MTVNSSQISTTAIFPQDPPALVERLQTIYGDIAYRLNAKDLGVYDTNEISSVQQWFSSAGGQRIFAFRKVFTGTIAAPGTTSIAHGLTVAGYRFTRIYGTAGNGSNLFIPLPQATPDDVAITVDATNINVIASTATYNGLSLILVLEYLKR